MTTAVTAQHVASSTAPCGLAAALTVSPYVVAEDGYCLAVRALESKEGYNQIEGADGVFRTIVAGDVLAGALGERQALKGYSGRIPRRIAPGDVLHVLNMGGILGLCTTEHPDLGPALRVEVLGAVLTDAGRHARIQDHAIDWLEHLAQSAPLVMVSGTAMNTGKTYAAAQLTAGLTARGLRVAAAKLTGASLMRDVRAMQANGAVAVATFTEAGVVASTDRNMVPVAKGLVAHLDATARPDVMVLELGDGIIGPYGVDDILQDMELQRLTAAHVLAATDLAGAWAADQIFRTRYRAELAAVVGPATDTEVGRRYLQNTLGVAAVNARAEPERLADLVAARVTRFAQHAGDGFGGAWGAPAPGAPAWEAAR